MWISAINCQKLLKFGQQVFVSGVKMLKSGVNDNSKIIKT